MKNAQTLPGRRRALRVVVFTVPPAEELDIVGPWDVFSSVNSALREQGPMYDMDLVTAGRHRTFRGDSGLTLSARYRYTEVHGEIDTLVVVGGTGATTSRDRAVASWIRKVASRARRVASICTGAFLLAEAGLLDGRRATTHWMFTTELAARYPKVEVDPDPIFVRDGNVYTSAGVTAGMDLASRARGGRPGSAMALRIARTLALFLRRPGGQAQFSDFLFIPVPILNHYGSCRSGSRGRLSRDLSVGALASRVAMSERNFARVFARESGTTPAQYVEQLRLEAARRELELTDKGLKQVALASGFRSIEVLRRAFMRYCGKSPSLYREHFSRRAQRP